jgi:uncharacterized protein involved in response to NO
VANALVHGEALGATTDTASLGLDLAAHAIVVMIVIIAGRVIPFFIETRLVGARPHRGKAAQGIAIVAPVLGVAAREPARRFRRRPAAGLGVILPDERGWGRLHRTMVP